MSFSSTHYCSRLVTLLPHISLRFLLLIYSFFFAYHDDLFCDTVVILHHPLFLFLLTVIVFSLPHYRIVINSIYACAVLPRYPNF